MIVRSLAAAVIVAVCAQSAAAESLTPAEGGPGGSAYHLRCPSGPTGQTYLMGVKARLGALMDFVAPVCAIIHRDSVAGAVRFSTTLPDTASPRGVGGTGGEGFYYMSCDELDQVVTQISVETMAYLESGQYKSYVSDASVGCQRMGPPGDFDGSIRAHRVGAGYDKANYGWSGVLSCPPGQWAVGIHGRASGYVHKLGLICDAPFDAPAPMAVPLPVDPDAVQQGKMFEESVDPNALQTGGGGLFEEGVNANAIGN